MTRKILSISIGIPAYNEEHNIKNLLLSVCTQNQKKMKIKEILVMSDGSKDQTVEFAKQVKDKRIKVFDFSVRRGKPTMLNRLFKEFTGDILVSLDADAVLRDKNVLDTLVKGFYKNGIEFVCGNAQPLPGQTFIEKAVNNFMYARNEVMHEFTYKEGAYIAHGFVAYTRRFLKGFKLPKEILNDDAFSYFYCITKGYGYFFEKKAIFWYKSPQTIKDHIAQATRHFAGGIQLEKYFDKTLVADRFSVPKKIQIKIMVKQLLRNPLGYIVLRILNSYCIYKSKEASKTLNVRWRAIASSKIPIL